MRSYFTNSPPEFDKRTHLGVGRTFTKIIESDPIMSETMAKAVCAQMSTDLSKIVPQVDDYSCPICSEVQWRPVRMKCQHIFCSSCAVKMQKQRRKFCPLCREDVVLQADEGKYISVLCHYFEGNVMSERVNLNLPRPGIKHRADLCSR